MSKPVVRQIPPELASKPVYKFDYRYIIDLLFWIPIASYVIWVIF